MEPHDLVFVIPTYRLRDVGETVEQYDQHFWRNGHALPIIVFDDSSPANQDKYFPLHAAPAIPRGRIRLDGLVRNLFRPSYGGNRNCALMYTLGSLVVSSDDDMRPYALMEDSPESLVADEISRGRLHKAGHNHIVHKSFDILAAFKDVLSKPVAEFPENYDRVVFSPPRLPDGLEELSIYGLGVRDARVDLRIVRHGGSVGVNVLSHDRIVDVVVT